MQSVVMGLSTSVCEIQKYRPSRSTEVCRFDPSISIDFQFITTILWSYFDKKIETIIVIVDTNIRHTQTT